MGISVPDIVCEALNVLNQAKVCHFQPIKKLACGIK